MADLTLVSSWDAVGGEWQHEPTEIPMMDPSTHTADEAALVVDDIMWERWMQPEQPRTIMKAEWHVGGILVYSGQWSDRPQDYIVVVLF